MPHPASGSILSTDPGGQLHRAAQILLVLLLLSGAGFRAMEYMHDRSLWLDEAALAQNLLHLPAGQLALGRLTNDQVAPPGFLLTVKGLTALAGSGEPVLRLLPFVAGLAGLGLFGYGAWKRLGPLGGLAATALLAWSWPLIYYSAEFKQYSTDALVAWLLFVMGENFLGQTLTGRRAWLAGAAGVGGLLFSHPAVFLLGAWWLQGRYDAQRQKQPGEVRRWNWIGLAWGLAVAGQVWANYTATLGNTKLMTYHAETFLRVWPLTAAAQTWHDGLYGLWALATAEATWWLWLMLFLAGLWAGWRRYRRETRFIGLTVMFTMLASLLHVYPWTPRLLLFLLPLLFWLVGRGADGLAGLARGGAMPVVAVAVAAAAWPLWSDDVDEARDPIAREHLRPVAARLAEQARPGDVVLVFDYTRYAFDYYWPRQAHADVPVFPIVFEKDEPLSPSQLSAKVAPLLATNPQRVWLVATHYELGAGQDNLRALVAVLRSRYPGAADFVPPGGTAQGVVFFRPGPEPGGRP
jgi:hypothetical protein